MVNTIRNIYMDYAAATPLDKRVQAAMEPFFTDAFYNPSANYAAARQVADQLEAARSKAAHWLGARPAEIIFTAGGTEADNLAVHGVMRKFLPVSTPSDGNGTPNVVVSAVEHDAVLRPADDYECRFAPVTTDGLVDLKALQAVIDNNTVLVSIMYANNEVGTVQPVKRVAELVKQIREERRRQGNSLPLYLHTDACQASNYLDLHAARLGVDLMTLNGGKMYGPKQSGVLYVKAGIELAPLITGGGQERGLRSGTENVAACVGLATALDIAQTDRHNEQARMQVLQKRFIMALTDTDGNISNRIILNGTLKKRLPNNIHITIPGYDNERLLLELENRGVLAAAGSACSASSDEPSHVLKAMGFSDAEAQSSLRFTMGRSTTESDVDEVVDALHNLIS